MSFEHLRGAVVQPNAKVQKTVRLDLDVLSWLMREGERRGIPYQTLLNSLLKEQCVARHLSATTSGKRSARLCAKN